MIVSLASLGLVWNFAFGIINCFSVVRPEQLCKQHRDYRLIKPNEWHCFCHPSSVYSLLLYGYDFYRKGHFWIFELDFILYQIYINLWPRKKHLQFHIRLGEQFLKKGSPKNKIYRLNLIFWIVMGCGADSFGGRGLKT